MSLTIKVKRKVMIETDMLEVGDQIKVKFFREKHKATAIKREDDGMLFLLDDCLDEAMPMNKNGGNDGDYDASDLRKYLAQKASEMPRKLKDRMVPFENGDYLMLLTTQEACGVNADFNDAEGQIELMKDRRHRVATRKDNEYANWWLRDAVSAAYFAYVTANGNCNYCGASDSCGVRPAFKIRDLLSKEEKNNK